MSTGLAGIALPTGWEWRPLKHMAPVITRGTAPNYVDEGPVRVIGQAANQWDGIDWDRTRYHDFVGNPAHLKGHLLPGDVLINSTGRGTLGRVGYFTGSLDELPCMADGHVTLVRSQADILDPRFAYYYFSSEPFQHFIYAALVVGATNQIELVAERLCAAPVPLPPLEEQRRIADFLDGETTRLAALENVRARQRAFLDEHVYAEISETLLPGILTDPSGEFPYPWLPKLSPEIPLVRLGYICRLQTGLTVDGARNLSGDVVTRPYLRVANVQAGRVLLDSVTEITVPRAIAERSTLRPGDVLMTEGGDLDKLGRGTVWRGELPDCLHQNHVFALRPDPAKLDPDYLSLLTQSLHGRCYFESTGVRTTNLASTNSSKILSFPVPLPSISRQRELVNLLREKLEITERAKELLDEQVTRIQERRQALITAAVTGQIDVTTAREIDA
ncbi:hypothetical protein C3Y87_15830 [Carbonactinospora thermoautotrophica]|uniref:restriction endonuclease subunit S n=1 Tax=Carbonactinospora thermoautotrophica TaxID=1469144 RepID=UPI0022705A11|nr:restriction endonuclease subunit S [Carbonactinospora thermoautotrophica]MCX9192858.1 hypothetical protein [Carbonactinospora thermoautotrophica]